ncbi:MAG: hypothetical protein M1822_010261 [Bathelium mastoideum]|nr:MAG: hypothetical protein M1822_010261 [Bathelium mastoideum]
MLDPLSVAGLVIAVGQVIAAVSKYPKQVKNAKSDISILLKELLYLQGILVQVQNQFRSQSDAFRVLWRLPEYESVLSSCHEELTALLMKLEPNRGSFKAKFQVPLWPFTKDQLDERIGRLEKVKSGLTLIMLAISNDGIGQISTDLQSIVQFFQGEQQIRYRQVKNDARIRIFEKLAAEDPTEAHARCLRLTHPETGTWFLDGPFQAWSQDQGPTKTLLLRGKSGAGKSVLFSNAVARLNTLEERSPKVISAIHYCKFDNLDSQDVSAVLGSLLRQLFSKSADLYEQHQETLNSQIPDTVTERSALLAICCEYFSKVYLCVDALNESRHGKDIFELLANIARKAKTLFLLFTTTSLDGIADSEYWNETAAVEFDKNGQRQDITAYISARTQSSQIVATLGEELRTEIHSRLLAESDGSFRFVQCQCDHLASQRTGKAVRTALRKTPHGLNEYYASILDQISRSEPDDRPIVKEALMWLSIMPLTLEQLCEALAIEEESSKIDDENRIQPPEIILGICKSLVNYDLDTQTISLAHSSVQTFLLSTHDTFTNVAYFQFSRAELLNMVLRKYLTYLLFEDFNAGFPHNITELQFLFRQYPLLSTTAQWPNIVKQLDEYSLHIGRAEIGLIMRLFDTRKMPKRGNFGLFLAAIYPDIQIEPEIYRTTYQVTTPLYMAASSGMTSIVKHLLSISKADIETKGGRFDSAPLQVAIFRRRCKTVDALLDAGADPSSTNCSGTSCLSFARRCMHCMSRLLEAGAADEGGLYRAWAENKARSPNSTDDFIGWQVLGDRFRVTTASTEDLPEKWLKR